MERMDTREDDDFNAKSEAFLVWLKQNGATISPKIKLADLREHNEGRGVTATESLVEDEELFSIPRTSILTFETSSIPESIQRDLRARYDDQWLLLISAMVLEYMKGAESPWRPYFDLLPESFDSLMFWSDTELKQLDGSAVVHKIGKAGADATFEEQLVPSIEQAAASLKLSNAISNAQLLNLCHRMGSTIMAYAFDLEKTSDQSKNEEDGWEEDEETETLPKGMVPLADMLNADADSNNAKLFYEDDKVVMKTIKPVAAGEQLFNDFGALPRADLLRRYGYITNNYAKYDVVEISTDLIREKAAVQMKLPSKELVERWAYLEEHGILDDAFDISRASAEEGQFPEELCILLNLLVTPKAEFDKLKKKDKLPKTDLTMEAKTLLRTNLVHRYAMYPSDSSFTLSAESARQDRRQRMALQVIDGEKTVLREAIEALSDAKKGAKKRLADTLDEEVATIKQPLKK